MNFLLNTFIFNLIKDNDLKVDFIDTNNHPSKKIRARLTTKTIQGSRNELSDPVVVNRLGIYQKCLKSVRCGICNKDNTLTMNIYCWQAGSYDICCSNCGLRIQDPKKM